MQAHLEEWPQPAPAGRPLAAACRRHQGAEPVQHPEGLAVVRHRQAVAQPGDDGRHGRRPAVEHAQQVHERGVFAQPVAEGQAPPVGAEVALDGGPEEELVLRAEVRLGRRVQGRVDPGGQVVGRVQVPADDGPAEKGVDALPDLADDRPRLERLVEDARRVVEQPGFVARVAEGGRRARADQLVARHPEPHPQAPDQARQVGALGAVEGVQLVDTRYRSVSGALRRHSRKSKGRTNR